MEIVQKKICLMGDFAVGKTSLVRRYIEGQFKERYLSTMGVSISRKAIPRGDYRLHMLLWDLAGGEEFAQHQASYLRGTAGALIVCDITRKETLDDLSRYAEQVREANPDSCLIFLANKVDLEDQFDFGLEDLALQARSWRCPYLLTSAKTGQHVENAFLMLADQLELSR
jgi:small GTP-binding protein